MYIMYVVHTCLEILVRVVDTTGLCEYGLLDLVWEFLGTETDPAVLC